MICLQLNQHDKFDYSTKAGESFVELFLPIYFLRKFFRGHFCHNSMVPVQLFFILHFYGTLKPSSDGNVCHRNSILTAATKFIESI